MRKIKNDRDLAVIRTMLKDDIEFDLRSIKDDREKLEDEIELARCAVERYDLLQKLDSGLEEIELDETDIEMIKQELLDTLSGIQNELETETDQDNIDAFMDQKVLYEGLLVMFE